MNKSIVPLLTAVLAVSLVFAGCAPPKATVAPEPPEEAPPETQPQIPESQPELPEATKKPAEDEDSMPILTDGTHSWRLKATTFSEEITEGGQVLEPIEERVFLQAEFENLSELDLIDGLLLETTSGEEPRPSRIFLAGGIETVVVTDSRGDTHPAVILDASKITFVVPDDQHEFTLHFLDWAPIELEH